MKRKRKPTAAGDVVAKLLEAQGADPRQAAGAIALRIYAAFAKLGPPISEHAEPVMYGRGVLTLRVDQSVWLTELQFLAPRIVKRMNAILGRDLIKEIRMRLGPLERPPPAVVPPKPVPRAAKERIAAWSEEIGDEEVRNAVRRAAERHAAHPKKKIVDVSGPPGPRVARPDPDPEPEPMKYGYGDKPRDRWKGKKPRW